MLLIITTSKSGKLFEVELISNKPQLPYLNTKLSWQEATEELVSHGQTLLSCRGIISCSVRWESMDNPRINQAVGAS